MSESAWAMWMKLPGEQLSSKASNSSWNINERRFSSAGEAALPGAFPGGKGIVSSLLKCTHKRLRGPSKPAWQR